MAFFAEIEGYFLVMHGKSLSTVKATIALYDTNNNFRAHLHFQENDQPLLNGTESVMSGVEWCRIYMHLSELPSAVDMLRNEKPVFVYYHNPTRAYIRTGLEPVGEGELP